MKKTHIAAYTVILLFLVLQPVQAATDKAGEMEAGSWSSNPRYVTFGDYNDHPLVWRVLEVKDSDPGSDGMKTAFLLLDNLLQEINGDVKTSEFGSTNSFPDSVIKEWLNDGENGFMARLGNYQADILDTTYRPGNGMRIWLGGISRDTSKIFLLSAEEVENKNYFENESDRASVGSWWLRSPGLENDTASSVLYFGDIARNGPFVFGSIGIRPAIKIKLSPPSAFIDAPVTYRLTLKVDDENYPVPGAKVTLFSPGKTQGTKYYSNSVGITHFTNVAPGEYTITVSKTGYLTKSENIIVPALPTISLETDRAAIPDKVRFGKYNGAPIEWNVLDIVNGRALLFAGALFPMNFDTKEGSNIWANSSLRDYMNSNKAEGFRQESVFNTAGGFLHETNFTVAETTAIDASASATGDSVFLLSVDEVFSYMTDANMRYFDDKQWLTRTPGSDDTVQLISPDGEHGGSIPAYTRNLLGWVRPAVWVDLSKLTYDEGAKTLVAAP